MMNLLQLGPTQMATCPGGTSEGVPRLAVTRAFLRQRSSICRIRTMCRILLHLLVAGDIFWGKVSGREEGDGGRVGSGIGR